MQVINIPAHEAAAQMQAEQGELLDVRTASEYEAGHLQGSQNIDFLSGEFQAAVPTFSPDKTYYLYCRSGARSGKAAEILLASGFTKVYNIGGFEGLALAGLPVEY
jgi:phage shock protein E